MPPVNALAATMPDVTTVTKRPDLVVQVRVPRFSVRAGAALVDTLIVGGLTAVICTLAALALGEEFPTGRAIGPDLMVAGLLDRSPMAVGGVGVFLGLSFLYLTCFEGLTGQTFGKKLFKMRVVSKKPP